MRIGILQTDHVLEQFQNDFGDYPAMFMELLSREREDLLFSVYDVQAEIPSGIDCDAYLITGSRHSVYDDCQWIENLVAFVRQALAAQRKILGICFGHQLMAHYFGGEVAAANGGWAVGIHSSDIVRQTDWMAEKSEQIRLISSHKDQVRRLPAGAELYATNSFCPLAGFTMGDQVWTIQGHPEFKPAYSNALMNFRREIIGEQVFQNGVSSLQQDTDDNLIARWMLDFVETGHGRTGRSGD